MADKRVLLVDDDHEIVESMSAVLGARGFEVYVAGDGAEGIQSIKEAKPDVIVLDMMMPKRSGFMVLQELRDTLKLKTPVIMITANQASRHRAYAERLGVAEYLQKPFGMDQLIDAVNRVLQ